MLSSVPIELQTHTLSYLSRKDLAAVARVSQHLHAVAIKILYLKVELKSWDHVESFFLPGSLIPSGSISATEHAEARRKHWESIKELTISMIPSRSESPNSSSRDRSEGGTSNPSKSNVFDSSMRAPTE